MNIAVFSPKAYNQHSFEQVNEEFSHQLTFFDTRLTTDTASLAKNFEGACVFVNDEVGAAAIWGVVNLLKAIMAPNFVIFNNCI
jgi:D-lactate dehydrogenase